MSRRASASAEGGGEPSAAALPCPAASVSWGWVIRLFHALVGETNSVLAYDVSEAVASVRRRDDRAARRPTRADAQPERRALRALGAGPRRQAALLLERRGREGHAVGRAHLRGARRRERLRIEGLPDRR